MGGGDPRMGVLEYGVGWGVGVLEYGKNLRPQNWVWDQFLVPFFTMGTNIGLFGLKLFPVILTFRDDFNGSTPEGPRPYI